MTRLRVSVGLSVAVLLASVAMPSTVQAATTEDLAVIRHCGTPVDDRRGVSPVTNEFTRDLYYPNNLVIHFLPVGGGWQLESAWMQHIPVTRNGVADRLPCVREALAEASLAPAPNIDPTISAQSVSFVARQGFGIPFLWLILALAITLILFVVFPARRKKTQDLPLPRMPRREPEVIMQERLRQSSATRKIQE